VKVNWLIYLEGFVQIYFVSFAFVSAKQRLEVKISMYTRVSVIYVN